MNAEQRERELRAYRLERNLCPTHGSRMVKAYYKEFDLMVWRCQDKDCIDGHSMEENFRYGKRPRKFSGKKVRKAIDKVAKELDTEDLQTQK